MERPLSPLPPLTALHDTESHSDKAVLSGLLGSAIPQFLLDNRRPDSPLPPLYTHHSLPSSPQTLSMMSAPARSIGKQTLAPLTTTQGDSDMFADILRLPTSHGRVSSRLRSRSSQSTEDLYGNAIDAAMASSGYPTLPRTRSQLNLDSNGKGRRSRTH